MSYIPATSMMRKIPHDRLLLSLLSQAGPPLHAPHALCVQPAQPYIGLCQCVYALACIPPC